MNVAAEMFKVLRCIANEAAQCAAYKNWTDEFRAEQIRDTWNGKIWSNPNPKIVFTKADVESLSQEDRNTLGFGVWDREKGTLLLIPLWIYRHIKDGEPLVCISGKEYLSGQDNVDLDVRGGCIAYGFLITETPDAN